jgi:hypothetical protein
MATIDFGVRAAIVLVLPNRGSSINAVLHSFPLMAL